MAESHRSAGASEESKESVSFGGRACEDAHQPRQQPDESFYELARQLSAVGNSLNQIAAKAHSLGYIDEVKYEEEVRRLHMLQADLEEAVLAPVKRSI